MDTEWKVKNTITIGLPGAGKAKDASCVQLMRGYALRMSKANEGQAKSGRTQTFRDTPASTARNAVCWTSCPLSAVAAALHFVPAVHGSLNTTALVQPRHHRG